MNKRKNLQIQEAFKSNYCKLIFIISIIIISIIIPKKIFHSCYSLLGILFIIETSLLITCITKNIKEKILLAKSSGMSILGIITIILGFGALQACTIGAPVCATSIGLGAAAIIFPSLTLPFFEEYSILIIVGTLIIQAAALYHMSCSRTKNKL